MKYLARRLLHGIVLLVGVSFLSFLLTEMAPGSFFEEMRLNPQISPETVGAMRARYGLDRPLPVRYAHWVRSVLGGELGFSFASNAPVAGLLWPRAKNTLLLTSTATLLAWLLAIPMGIWSAARRGCWEDRLTSAGTSLLLAIPDLLLALGLLLIAARSGVLPTGGITSLDFAKMTLWGKARDLAAHMLLPVLTLVLGLLPVLVRHTRAAMTEALGALFLQAARGHGITPRRLLLCHALPVAANPLITLFGFSVAGLLSSSLLVEVILGWPGLGPLLLEAILARDMYVVIGAIMASTLFLVFGNLLADVLLYASDPRIRTE